LRQRRQSSRRAAVIGEPLTVVFIYARESAWIDLYPRRTAVVPESILTFESAKMTFHTLDLVGGQQVIIVVHIAEKLNNENKTRIKNQLCLVTGIVGLEFDNSRPNLLLVNHSPSQIEASSILRLLQNLNLHARLIVGV
jgi:hypothetical protein